MCRLLTSISRWQVREMHGLEHIAAAGDPFILALNHSQRPEAVLVPAWLCYHRQGRLVHFMVDWNFLLVPGLAWVIRLHDPIVVVRKPAKPTFLNRYKSRFEGARKPFEEARVRLAAGRSVGIFPEATVNRHPGELLRGQRGVARLAIEARVPVVPGGIRFLPSRLPGPIRDREPFTVHFGPALFPPIPGSDSGESVSQFHEQIMRAISTLSGKQWQPEARRTKYAFEKA
jgi:1-acyl-sn-glycerol-3-phosphate acyltransferase